MCALKEKVIVAIDTHHLYALARYCVYKNKGLVPWIQVGNEHVGIVGAADLRWQWATPLTTACIALPKEVRPTWMRWHGVAYPECL